MIVQREHWGHITKSRLRSHLLGAAPPFKGVAGVDAKPSLPSLEAYPSEACLLVASPVTMAMAGVTCSSLGESPPSFWEFKIRLAHARDGGMWALGPEGFS